MGGVLAGARQVHRHRRAGSRPEPLSREGTGRDQVRLPLAHLWTLRNGQAMRMDAFSDHQEACEAVRLADAGNRDKRFRFARSAAASARPPLLCITANRFQGFARLIGGSQARKSAQTNDGSPRRCGSSRDMDRLPLSRGRRCQLASRRRFRSSSGGGVSGDQKVSLAPRAQRAATQSGGMFWLSRKKLSGSYLRLSAFRRSYFVGP
jgi:hypothetical protein